MSRVYFNCPTCDMRLTAPEDLQPGAKVRCTRCRNVFRYPPQQNGPAEETPFDEGPEYDVMVDLLAEDDETTLTKAKARAAVHHAAAPEPAPPTSPITGSPLPRLFRSKLTRQPVAGHPLAQVSERSKEKLVGGKGVRFEEPRKYMGVLIGFLVLAGLYAGFLAFSAFWTYYNNVAQKRAADIEHKTKEADRVKKKRFEQAVAKAHSKGVVPGAGKTTAGHTAQESASQLKIEVRSVQLGALFPPDQTEYLVVNLRIRNKSRVAGHQAHWHGPQVVARLRGTGLVPYQMRRGLEKDQAIPSGGSLDDSVVFERTVPGQELTLELTIPPARTPMEKLTIPPAQIQRGP